MECLVTVAVFGVAGVSFSDDSTGLPSPFVQIKVFEQTKKTKPKSDVASCNFGNFFSISSNMTIEDFASKDVEVKVIHQGYLFAKDLGQVVFSLCKVRAHRQHRIGKTWFPIALPDRPDNVTGFVQLAIGAYGPGDTVAVSAGAGTLTGMTGHNRSVGNRVVNLPKKSDAVKSLCQLCVRIYQAEGLLQSYKPFVRVDFNGTSQETKRRPGEVSPIWNEEVQVPYVHPCWDDSINVQLYGQDGMLIGEVCLSIVTIAKTPHLAWHNFYAEDTRGSTILGGLLGTSSSAKSMESVFAGRLLVAAHTERCDKMTLGVSSCSTQAPPPQQQYVLWVDFYQVCFDSIEDSSELYVTFSMEPLLSEQQSQMPNINKHGFVWMQDHGRMREVSLSLPDAQFCPDLIVSVYLRSKSSWLSSDQWERHMFLRIPATELMHWECTPKWREMQYVQGVEGISTAGFILMSANAGPDAMRPSKQPRLQKLRFQKYMFRACIYQAVNLPARDVDGSSDPLVAVLFGSAHLQTDMVPNLLSPTWNQVLEAEVEVPENEALRPDIIVIVLDQDEDKNDLLVMLRIPTQKAVALPQKWHGPPRWFDLEPIPGGVPTTGRILASFELRPVSDNSSGHSDSHQTIKLPTLKTRVDFFAVGVRMNAGDGGLQLTRPCLEVSWGRKTERRAERRQVQCTQQGHGTGGQFNFLECLQLVCKLAKDPHYKEWLEVKLFDEDNFKAFALVPLSAHLHWIDETHRQKAQRQYDTFVTRQRDEVHAVEFDHDGHDHDKCGGDKWKQLQRTVQTSDEAQLCRRLGWDVVSIDESNARVQHQDAFVRLSDTTEPTEQNSGFVFDEETDENAILSDFKGWQWPERDLDRHGDLDCALEFSDLPYLKTPLLIGSECGQPQLLGVLKYCCRVVEHGAGGASCISDADWLANLVKIKDVYQKQMEFCIRAYILSAEGLAPHSGSSDCSSYVWSKAACDQSKQRQDDTTMRHHTLHPKFNTCHAHDRCKFPGNCLLEVAVMEREQIPMLGSKDYAIGSTVIDIEDRWFSSNFREMIKNQEVPIEALELRCPESNFSKGHIRMWVDVLDKDESKRDVEELPSTEKEPFILEITIWRVTNLELKEGTDPEVTVYLQATHVPDDGYSVHAETDRHLGVGNKIALFHYCLCFRVDLPCINPNITFQLWLDKTGFDDILAEVTLDLGRDFDRARQDNVDVSVQRGTVQLVRPSRADEVCGKLDLEYQLLTDVWQEDVKMKQKELEPRDDPQNPEALEKLLENRRKQDVMQQVIDSGKKLVKYGGFMLGGFGLIYMAGSIVSGVVIIGTTIYTLTK